MSVSYEEKCLNLCKKFNSATIDMYEAQGNMSVIEGLKDYIERVKDKLIDYKLDGMNYGYTDAVFNLANMNIRTLEAMLHNKDITRKAMGKLTKDIVGNEKFARLARDYGARDLAKFSLNIR